MAEITMPKIGDSMVEGTVVRWFKHEGDLVDEGDSIAEIETDKVNIEMESFAPGLLVKILVQEGQMVPVGETIAILLI